MGCDEYKYKEGGCCGGDKREGEKGLELKEITPWEVLTNYILVFNEGGKREKTIHTALAEGELSGNLATRYLIARDLSTVL